MKKCTMLTCLLVCSLFVTTLMAEQQRHIHINGEHLSETVINQLDSLVGSKVDDGYYWLNLQTGEWGYQDNPQIQGVLQAIAQAQVPQQNETAEPASVYRDYEGVSSTGTVTSGRLNGKNCTYISVGGTTMKSCD